MFDNEKLIGMKKLLYSILILISAIAMFSCKQQDEPLYVRKIYVDPESVVLGIGHNATIVPTALPDRITDAVFSWRSDDESIATVDQDGVVTGVSKGETVVHVTSGDVTVDIPVTVYLPLSDISIDFEGDILDLKIQNGVAVTVNLSISKIPENAEEAIVCESSDNAIVTISNDGLVTPIGAGQAKLTIRGEGGVVSKEIDVVVTKSGDDAVKLDGTKFNFLYTVTGDNCQDMSEWWPMINLFDGKRDVAGGTSPTSGDYQSFTVDLGAKYNIAYLHLFTWQGVATDGPQYHPFGEKNIKYMEVFGSESLDETGDWSKWTKLMDCHVTKPSGLPEGEYNEDDMAAWSAGQIFFTDSYDTTVRYLRVRINETWNGTWGFRCSEMEFYGSQKAE